VLLEKPVANSEKDVETMVAAYRDAPAGLKVQVGYILRFNPVYEAIQRAVPEENTDAYMRAAKRLAGY
jgi:predicted dehydrogenase